MRNKLLHFNQEVLRALEGNLPIVALESTIFSHGLAYPENLETAKTVDRLIRDAGAVPANIALYQGKIHIGMDEDLMEILAKRKDVIHAARRDIAYILSRKMLASTTVAATMFCAHFAGLPLFVTGSIGGIHHQVGEVFDISADLIELSFTPVTIICSGAKSILDLPKTLEILETHGVAIVGYCTDEFPAFYTHSSGIPLLHRLDTPEEIATLMHYQRNLAINNGIVIANPILPYQENRNENTPLMLGKEITPLLLQQIALQTSHQNLQTNIELIKNNAVLGAEITIAYKKQQNSYL